MPKIRYALGFIATVSLLFTGAGQSVSAQDCVFADSGCYSYCGIQSPFEDYFERSYVRLYCWDGTRWVLHTYNGDCCYSA